MEKNTLKCIRKSMLREKQVMAEGSNQQPMHPSGGLPHPMMNVGRGLQGASLPNFNGPVPMFPSFSRFFPKYRGFYKMSVVSNSFVLTQKSM